MREGTGCFTSNVKSKTWHCRVEIQGNIYMRSGFCQKHLLSNDCWWIEPMRQKSSPLGHSRRREQREERGGWENGGTTEEKWAVRNKTGEDEIEETRLGRWWLWLHEWRDKYRSGELAWLVHRGRLNQLIIAAEETLKTYIRLEHQRAAAVVKWSDTNDFSTSKIPSSVPCQSLTRGRGHVLASINQPQHHEHKMKASQAVSESDCTAPGMYIKFSCFYVPSISIREPTRSSFMLLNVKHIINFNDCAQLYFKNGGWH